MLINNNAAGEALFRFHGVLAPQARFNRVSNIRFFTELSFKQQPQQQVCFSAEDSDSSGWVSKNDLVHEESGGAGLLKIAGVIGAATTISKVLGLARELVLAAVFGVGSVVDAFGYASIIPGFFLAVLGGINGPIHVTMATFLSKLSEEKRTDFVDRLTSSVLLVSFCFGSIVFISAGRLLDTFAPGLMSDSTSRLLTRSLAILQLRIMAPCVTLGCLMGIGYGRLSVSGRYGLASLSPAISSLIIICSAGLYSILCSQGVSLSSTTGGVLLAAASTVGALVQWLLQIKAQGQQPAISLRWENPFRHEDVKEFLFLMIPAAITSGMLQFATYTDLYFASYFPQAAASLGYANLLVMAPLGIISSAVLIPMLPVFSRLSEPAKRTELRSRVRQGLQLCIALTLPLTAILIPLAKPVVRILFQRYAFDAAAAESVSLLVIYYVTGSTCYLIRDFLVRVFYSLGDSQAPFYISAAAILANAALDFLLIHKAGFGPEGLVMATSIVNFLSAAALWQKLSNKIQDLTSADWLRSLLVLSGCAVFTMNATAVTYKHLQIRSVMKISWITELVRVAVSSFIGAASFVILLFILRPLQNHLTELI